MPAGSVLNQGVWDYVDSFQGTFTDQEGKLRPADIGKLFFRSGPKWIDFLFAFRNKVVGFIGLKAAGNTGDKLARFQCEEGEQLGLFKVYAKTENEVVLGQNDRHLNFRVSLFLGRVADREGKRALSITTTVKFHNRMGRLYFVPVKQFHKRIVPSMLRGMLRNLADLRPE